MAPKIPKITRRRDFHAPSGPSQASATEGALHSRRSSCLENDSIRNECEPEAASPLFSSTALAAGGSRRSPQRAGIGFCEPRGSKAKHPPATSRTPLTMAISSTSHGSDRDRRGATKRYYGFYSTLPACEQRHPGLAVNKNHQTVPAITARK